MSAPDDNDLVREHGRGAYDPLADLVPVTPKANGGNQTRGHAITQTQAFGLVRVADVPEIVELDWLVEGLIPRFDEGAAGYVFGPAKARKSLLLCDLALSVTSGTTMASRYPVKRQGDAIGFFAEDPRGETSRRIHRLARARGIAVPGNLYLLDVPRLRLDDPHHQEQLTETVVGRKDLALIWLDPMVRLHSVNDNHAEELAPIHSFLRELSRLCPTAVIVLAHHANKAGGSRGSTDFEAFGDFNLYLRKRDALTTEVHNIEIRGGAPVKPFKFSVKDGFEEGQGATMTLIAEDLVDGEAQAERTQALEEEVTTFKVSNPGADGRSCMDHLRRLGVKFSNNSFWAMWKEVRV